MDKARRIAIIPLGMTLGTFLAVTYTLCVLYGLLVSDAGMHRLLSDMLPGFTWITWPSYLIGLVWSIVFGWYVAAVFAPIYNFFIAFDRKSENM